MNAHKGGNNYSGVIFFSEMLQGSIFCVVTDIMCWLPVQGVSGATHVAQRDDSVPGRGTGCHLEGLLLCAAPLPQID